MTLLSSTRSRLLVASIFFALVALSFTRLLVKVQAAKQAIQAEDAHIAVRQSGPPTRNNFDPSHPPGISGKTPVLVELFTSEGCSSCPPADALLARLLQQQPVPNADIIVLEEHVDYWEALGWHDRFSARQFTDRQTSYAHTLNLEGDYTPQMVVDGAAQFVGNDSAQALRAIASAARHPKPALIFSPPTTEPGRIHSSVSAAAPASVVPKADVYAALIETMASTDVKGGENGGRTLHHVSVVRDLQKIGSSSELTGALSFSLAIPRDAGPHDLRVVAFVQRPGTGSILAVAASAVQPTD